MTVLIADDNALIRNWLKIMLRQLEGERLRLLEAADGDEALRICLEQPVDLLITDIKMPGQDGITLIKTLRAERPGIRSAVLSSYDDFAFVRVALKCGALDYILKAEMQQEDISSLLQKVKESLSLANGGQQYLQQYSGAIRRARSAYAGYLQGTDPTAMELLDCCGLDSRAARCCLVLFYISESTPQTAGACCNTLKMEGLSGVAFPVENEAFLMLYSLADEAVAQQRELHLRLLTALDQNLTAAHLGRLRQNVNVVFTRGESFSQKLRYARSLVDYQVYYGCSSLPEEEAPGHWESERVFLESLQTQINVQDYNRACYLLQKHVTGRHSVHELPHRVRRAVTAAVQMLLAAMTFDSRQGEDYRQLDRLVQEIADAKTAEQLRKRVNQFCASYLGYASQIRRVSSPAIARAVAYLNENYASRVTLEELAAYTRLNKSYFSQLFHKEVGAPFGDYLESVRIKNAQRLLREGSYSMADIAERVGFANQNYFTKVFKKVTGITPSQYKTALQDRKEK